MSGSEKDLRHVSVTLSIFDHILVTHFRQRWVFKHAPTASENRDEHSL